ncbi:MAG TPA: hypothetical protein VGH80_04285 [Xanthomonadaceae bacterium]
MQSLLEWFGAKPTLASFTGRLLRTMPRGEATRWRFDAGQGELLDDRGSTVSLHNMFLEYCNAPRSQRRELIGKYLEITRSIQQEVPALWVAAAKNVFPVVRSTHVAMPMEIAARGTGKGIDRFAAAPLAGDLQVCLMYDFGQSLKYVHLPQLETWGQRFEDVRERALANLAGLEPPAWAMHPSGFFRLTSRVSYEESMLLLGRVVDALPFREHAVLLPCNRGILLAADARRDDVVSAMLREAIRCAEHAPWPVSATLCTRRDGEWTTWEPGEATRALAHDLSVLHNGMNYHAQKDALDAWQERSGIDRFVAKYSILQRPDGLASFATWARNVHTLLPVADWIAIGGPAAAGEMEFKMVRWQNVVDVCGHRMRRMEESPTRYELDSFPDEAEWDRLQDERDAMQGGGQGS